jgi:type I restriction enzyme S subunit
MRKGWEMKKLGEVCELITKGTTPTSIGFKFTEEGINFIKVESLTESGQIITNKVAYISEKCHESLKRSQLKVNDILFSIAGALGRIGIVKKEILPANTNQALAIIRIDKNSMFNIFDEIVEGKKEQIPEIVKLVYDKPYQFLMINVSSQRFMKGFDELIF